MWLKELFERDNVDFPEWLSNEYLNNEWENATYLKGDNIHRWELNTPSGMDIITLEDEVYTFSGYDENNILLVERVITPEIEYTT